MINIHIEPTDFCNARCYYCVISQGNPPHLKRGGFLPLKIHHSLFKDLDCFLKDFSCAPTSDRSIYLRYCGVGEPTLHPDFITMFEEGLNFPVVKQLAILSNGFRWNKELVDRFIMIAYSQSTKLIELIFSLDTLRPQTQLKIKKLNNIKIIIEQLKYLLEQKVKNCLNNVHIVFQMIILEDNIIEIKEFCHFWANLLNDFGLSSKIVWAPDYPKYFLETDSFIWLKCRDSESNMQKKYVDLHSLALEQVGINFQNNKQENISVIPNLPSSALSSDVEVSDFVNICSMLWYGISISANGDVSPCCIDVNFELKLGNLKEASLTQIYRSQAMNYLRQAHIRGVLDEYPLCKNCFLLYRGTPVDKEDVVKYLNIISRKI